MLRNTHAPLGILCRQETRTHNNLSNDAWLSQWPENIGEHSGEHDHEAYLHYQKREREMERIVSLEDSIRRRLHWCRTFYCSIRCHFPGPSNHKTTDSWIKSRTSIYCIKTKRNHHHTSDHKVLILEQNILLTFYCNLRVAIIWLIFSWLSYSSFKLWLKTFKILSQNQWFSAQTEKHDNEWR